MEDYKITSAQISASSQYDVLHSPSQGRLNFKTDGFIPGCWTAGANDLHQWLQVDLRIKTAFTFVATQGRNHRNQYDQWVTKYKLNYSNDGNSFEVFKQDGESSDKVRQSSKYLKSVTTNQICRIIQ